MFGLFSVRSKARKRQAELPPGFRVYAVGDIHGRADLLSELQARIAEDAEDRRDLEKRVVYLGDYIDRGPSSREVLEALMARPPTGLAVTHLLGNHEAMLLRFLEDSSAGPDWIAYGGLATLLSYGVSAPGEASAEARLAVLQQGMREKFPARHKEFLAGLPTHLALGDYFFVHAGVRPGIPLDRQKPEDLIWIRAEFLRSEDFHGKIVVHGHSFETEPEIRANRIGIDTGAYATGRLTCLVLEGASRRFL